MVITVFACDSRRLTLTSSLCGWSPTDFRMIFTYPETRMIVLPDSGNRMIVSSFVWTKHRKVTDRPAVPCRATDLPWLLGLQRSALQAMRTRCKNWLTETAQRVIKLIKHHSAPLHGPGFLLQCHVEFVVRRGVHCYTRCMNVNAVIFLLATAAHLSTSLTRVLFHVVYRPKAREHG